MLKRKHLIKSKVGKPPGTLIYLSEKQLEKTTISFLEYDENEYTLKRDVSFPELRKLVKEDRGGKRRWINVNGLHNIDVISQIGEMFNIHSLILEDITNTYQRPKLEYYDDDIFLVMKKLKLNPDDSLQSDQVCLLLQEGYLISFTNEEDPGFENIYRRIEGGKKVLRKSEVDYLFYVVMDLVIDDYFVLTEELHDKLELLEDKLLEEPEEEDLSKIQIYKKVVMKTYQLINPVRDALNSLIRMESDLVKQTTLIYLRDSLDHQHQIVSNLDIFRESLVNYQNLYLSGINNRMNEVMKVLTIIATIFIPLTFIAGVYGMNFEYMPELGYKIAYPIIWIIMLTVAITLVIYFRKKDWF